PNPFFASAISLASRPTSRAGMTRRRGLAPRWVVNPSDHSSTASSKASYSTCGVPPVYSTLRVALVIGRSFLLVLPEQGQRSLPAAARSRLFTPFIGSNWTGQPADRRKSAGGPTRRGPDGSDGRRRAPRSAGDRGRSGRAGRRAARSDASGRSGA